jgi:preprotein translocase subunit SecG
MRDHRREKADRHTQDGAGGLNAMAAGATLHCLTGCAVGEIAGLMIGTAAGLSAGWTIVLAIGLAFLFGYSLSTLPLLKAGLGLGAAFGVVLAADTISIATMELVDNAVMAVIPGAMNAGLVNSIFWIGMMISLATAFLAAYPVNRYLLQRGKGHALTHGLHGGTGPVTGVRRYLPSFATSTLAAVIVAFMLGGLVVSVAGEMSDDAPPGGGDAAGVGQR